jgi:hypothetical protein
MQIMKKFTPQQRRQLKIDGYTDEEILEMEMESVSEEEEFEDDMEAEGELPTNSQNMRGIDWNALKKAGQPEMKRASIMRRKK